MSILQEPVLILNKNWFAIKIRNIIRAIKLVCRERAVFVDADDYSIYTWDEWLELPIKDTDDFIVSTSGNVKAPEVILLTYYKKIPEYTAKPTKKNIFTRDKYVCQYSGKKVNFKNADVDHITPKSRGGRNSWNNMVVCSKEINRKKDNRTPEEANLKLIRRPKQPNSKKLFIDPNIKIKESWSKFIS